MKCENCSFKTGLSGRDGKLEVNCQKNGRFVISNDYVDSFDCPLFQEQNNPVEETHTENCIIVLKSGRDIPFYMDAELRGIFNNEESFAETMKVWKDGFLLDENNFVLCSEVAAIHFL